MHSIKPAAMPSDPELSPTLNANIKPLPMAPARKRISLMPVLFSNSHPGRLSVATRTPSRKSVRSIITPIGATVAKVVLM